MLLKRSNAIMLGILFSCLFTSIAVSGAETFSFSSYKDIDDLFEKMGYTKAAWDKGIREVPPVFLTNIPNRWRGTNSKEVSTKYKKALFFRLLGPGVLHCNKQILAEREQLLLLSKKKTTNNKDAAWLLKLAQKYRVVGDTDATVNSQHIKQLLVRVDSVPPSLALAQGADESGWGTSRFAAEGNSLFGQHATTKNTQSIAAKGTTAVKMTAFDEPLDSIASYMLNLNSNSGYRELREKRAQLRQEGKKVTGLVLVDTLIHYSERGSEYTNDLKNIIQVNYLEATDNASLAETPSIELVPVTQ
ncbi:MAG: Bax protein [Desulforhopalus sp.]|jgi:Bax protein